MSFSAIAFVLVKAIVRIVLVIGVHEPVAADFSDDTGGGDGGDESITINNGFLSDG